MKCPNCGYINMRRVDTNTAKIFEAIKKGLKNTKVK